MPAALGGEVPDGSRRQSPDRWRGGTIPTPVRSALRNRYRVPASRPDRQLPSPDSILTTRKTTMRIPVSILPVWILPVAVLAALAHPAGAETRLLRFPDIHGDRVVFTYAGDLWSASTAGGTAVRLTSHPGLELFARFSPDGSEIAFTGQYDGDEQVYVMPAGGGVPKQLTFYPATGPLPTRWGHDNIVYDWSPDGEKILFRSLRDGNGVAEGRLHEVPRGGGLPTPLPMPRAGAGAWSPQGDQLVYSPLFRDFRAWKRYAGGWAQDLYVFDTVTRELTQITDDPRSDRDPMWIGSRIFFTSDRSGTNNLYSYDTESGDTRTWTDSDNWDVRWPGSDASRNDRLRAGGHPAPSGHRRLRGSGAHRDHRPHRRPAQPSVPGFGRRQHRALRHLADRKAPRDGGPGGALFRPRGEGGDAHRGWDSRRPREVARLVTGRDPDRLHLRRDRRGGDLRDAPVRRGGARAAHRAGTGDALRPRVVARRETDRLQRQGRPALRAHRRGQDPRRGRERKTRAVERLPLVAPGRAPGDEPERSGRFLVHLHLVRGGRRAAPGDGSLLQRVRSRLGRAGGLSLLPQRPDVPAADRGFRVELRARPGERDLRGRAPSRRSPPLPAGERRRAGPEGGGWGRRW